MSNPKVHQFQAQVIVTLRPSVLDPAGEAARSAASQLGVSGITNLRIGKSIDIELEATNEEEAMKKLELLSDRLLANPVNENWKLNLTTLDYRKN